MSEQSVVEVTAQTTQVRAVAMLRLAAAALIVVAVVIEIMKQVQAQMVMRDYEDF